MTSKEDGDKELSIPLVEATPVASKAHEAPAVTVVKDEEAQLEKNCKLVRLVAPSDLPAGYRLPIQYREGGKEVSGICRVPDVGDRRGIAKGQEFEAYIIPPAPVSGYWVAGLLDCGTLKDSAFCMLSICCTGIAWGCLYESAFKKPSGSCWIIIAVLTVLYYAVRLVLGAASEKLETTTTDNDIEEGNFLTMFLGILSWAMIITVTFIRYKIRQKFYIPGNCCFDCVNATCCGCCGAMQAYQQLERAQENPHIMPTNRSRATLIV